MPHANNKGADQPVHLRSLISTFVVRCLDSIIPLVSTSEISSLYLVSVTVQSSLSRRPQRQVFSWRGSFGFQLHCDHIAWFNYCCHSHRSSYQYCFGYEPSSSFDPPHDKTNKMTERPEKTQISLGIHPVWSVFAVRMKKPWVLSYTLSEQRRLWSDWVDAHADLSLCWAHIPFCWFCHVVAHFI